MPDEELLEIVNQNDQVVGQAKRRTIHKAGLWHRGVHVFLFTSERKLLVQKRSKYKVESPSTLDCSVSEHIKPGEKYLDGALRGLHEELGIDPIGIEYVMKFRMNYGPGDNHISALYEGVIYDTMIRSDSEEIDQINYYHLSELERLLSQGEVSFSNWFKQLLLWYLDKPSEVMEI